MYTQRKYHVKRLIVKYPRNLVHEVFFEKYKYQVLDIGLFNFESILKNNNNTQKIVDNIRHYIKDIKKN